VCVVQAYAAGIGGAIFPKEFGGTPPEGCARAAERACRSARVAFLCMCMC
jgi:hypothetical protein